MHDEPQGSEELLELFDLQKLDAGVFRGPPGRQWGDRTRVFGGQVLAQALAAACFSVPEDWPCHSLHAYFVRPGKAGRPIEYEVSNVRDGQSFLTRKVIAVQRDEVNCELIASFGRAQGGPAFGMAMPDTPAPETFPPESERIAQLLETAPAELHAFIQHRGPLEGIAVDGRSFGVALPHKGPVRTWVRARGKLADDPNLHRCALTYASDFGPVDPCVRAIGAHFGDASWQIASLDHALWFHDQFRFDDWVLFVFECSAVRQGRAFARGQVFTREGVLIASIAQELLLARRDGATST